MYTYQADGANHQNKSAGTSMGPFFFPRIWYRNTAAAFLFTIETRVIECESDKIAYTL